MTKALKISRTKCYLLERHAISKILSNQIHANLDNVLYSRKVTGFFPPVLFVNLVSAVQQGSYYGEIASYQRLSVLTTKPL